MIETFPIEGSAEVMAPYGPDKILIRGQRIYVKVTYSELEGDMLLLVRKALVGKIIPTIFTKKQLVAYDTQYITLLSDGARCSYVGDVSEALDEAGNHEAAALLRMEFKRQNGDAWARTMYVFDEENYEVQIRN